MLIYETPATFLTVLFLVWLLSGAAYLVHWPRFPIRAVNYLTAAYLIVSSEGVFNVECKFFIAMTFFNMGLRLRHGEEEQQLNRHIVHAMMLSFGAYLLLGGFLTKLQDEYWNSGIGLFHVVSLPWIAPEWIRSVLLLPLDIGCLQLGSPDHRRNHVSTSAVQAHQKIRCDLLRTVRRISGRRSAYQPDRLAGCCRRISVYANTGTPRIYRNPTGTHAVETS